MNKLFFTIVLAVSTLFINSSVSAQTTFAIGEPLIVSCGSVLVDNGLELDGYAPNSNDTSVICPDPAISAPQISALYFNVFDLGFGDQLTIYNGDNANAPLIGTYAGTDIQNQSFYSTDPTGCITVVFFSDADASVGDFSAEISCGIPCINPSVQLTSSEGPSPARICQQGEVTFDASATGFFNNGTHQSHVWQFGDGSIDTLSWPTVQHTFNEEGGYSVQLHVTDNNGCSNELAFDYLVYVSTTPNIQVFTSEADNVSCVDAPVVLQGYANSIAWSNVSDDNIDGYLFIPDDQTQCLSDTITYSGFDENGVIQSVGDIVEIFINLEHSYMGDLSIYVTCPNGSSVVLHNNGGSGTFLGEPIDNDNDLSPGIGYDYYWTPQAINGTWADNAGETLPSGTYQSAEPLTNLLGCPINGNWILEICDVLGSDNGFLFEWSIQFQENLNPSLISFTPTIETNCTSSFWTLSGQLVIVNSPEPCDSIVVTQSLPGNYVYTYHAIDNHGCEYTEDLEITFSNTELECLIAGCMDTAACNYNPLAGIEDNSCGPIVGSLCDDGDSTTINDVVISGCECSGVVGVLEETSVPFQIYPNPSHSGIFVLQGNILGFEQKELVMMDFTGKVVYKSRVSLNGLPFEVIYGQLASGMYIVMIDDMRMRLVVQD